MATVTFPNGHSYEFQGDFFGETGYEYLTTLPALFEDLVLLAADVVTDAAAAEAAAVASVAASASNGGTATSSTSMALGSGSKSITASTGKAFVAGQIIKVARTSDAINKYEVGTITAYNSGTGSLQYTVASSDDVKGSGTHTDWSISYYQPPTFILAASGADGGKVMGINAAGTAFKAYTDTHYILIQDVTDGDYDLLMNAPYSYKIKSITSQSTAGTATATFKNGSTPLGGTANSVSTTSDPQTHTTANDFAIGDDLKLTVSAASGCENASFWVEIVRL
jgi:hypothetical protein